MLTFSQTRQKALAYLAANGWVVRSNLDVPRAISADGLTHLWFKPQAVYVAKGATATFKEAHSLVSDLRELDAPSLEALALGKRAPPPDPEPQDDQRLGRLRQAATRASDEANVKLRAALAGPSLFSRDGSGRLGFAKFAEAAEFFKAAERAYFVAFTLGRASRDRDSWQRMRRIAAQLRSRVPDNLGGTMPSALAERLPRGVVEEEDRGANRKQAERVSLGLLGIDVDFYDRTTAGQEATIRALLVTLEGELASNSALSPDESASDRQFLLRRLREMGLPQDAGGVADRPVPLGYASRAEVARFRDTARRIVRHCSELIASRYPNVHWYDSAVHRAEVGTWLLDQLYSDDYAQVRPEFRAELARIIKYRLWRAYEYGPGPLSAIVGNAIADYYANRHKDAPSGALYLRINLELDMYVADESLRHNSRWQLNFQSILEGLYDIEKKQLSDRLFRIAGLTRKAKYQPRSGGYP